MLNFIKGSFVAIASSIPLDNSLSITKEFTIQPYVYQEYKSPTLNYNPFAEYEEKLLNDLIEKVFIQDQ